MEVLFSVCEFGPVFNSGSTEDVVGLLAELVKQNVRTNKFLSRQPLLGGTPDYNKTAGRLRRRLFERMREQDEVSLLRLRARFTGGDPDKAVAALGGSAAAWYRRGRRAKRWARWLRR